jgi:enoyl-CoA hydratase
MSRFRSETHDGVVHLLWDDGKANSVSSELLLELNEQLDQCERDEAKGLVLVGRPGVFCAGFNLKELGQGDQTTRDLVRGGAELLLRLYGLPIPVAIGCTGHALGMGGLLLLTADVRWGSPGPHKIGLNETAIGLSMPTFGSELASARLSRRHLQRSVLLAEIYGPDAAVDAGFLDRVCPGDTLTEALAAEGARLAAQGGKHFARTKRRLRENTIDRIRASFAHEL